MCELGEHATVHDERGTIDERRIGADQEPDRTARSRRVAPSGPGPVVRPEPAGQAPTGRAPRHASGSSRVATPPTMTALTRIRSSVEVVRHLARERHDRPLGGRVGRQPLHGRLGMDRRRC